MRKYDLLNMLDCTELDLLAAFGLSTNDNVTVRVDKINFSGYLEKVKGIESLQELKTLHLLSRKLSTAENRRKIQVMIDQLQGLADVYHFCRNPSTNEEAILAMVPFPAITSTLKHYASLKNLDLTRWDFPKQSPKYDNSILLNLLQLLKLK